VRLPNAFIKEKWKLNEKIRLEMNGADVESAGMGGMH
jgi:hypothetical protein